MAKHFFLNYGGPGGSWYSNDLVQTMYLDKICCDTYGAPIRKIKYTIKGIDVTICTYGIHRAVWLDVPDGASQETLAAFEKAAAAGYDICIFNDYSLLGHNCVTAVAKTLNTLDSRTTPADMVWPWNFDKYIKKYLRYYPKDTVAGSFMGKYTEIAARESFAFLRKCHWTEKTIESNQDIITHAYGKTGGTGERTKSTLIELGWVLEDASHILRPTEKAPLNFKTGLDKFNYQHEKMLYLKNIYKNEASFFSRNASNFFKDNPDYEVALQRVRQQAIKNPTGASAKALVIMDKEQAMDDEPRASQSL